jgi:hypothetical protein
MQYMTTEGRDPQEMLSDAPSDAHRFRASLPAVSSEEERGETSAPAEVLSEPSSPCQARRRVSALVKSRSPIVPVLDEIEDAPPRSLSKREVIAVPSSEVGWASDADVLWWEEKLRAAPLARMYHFSIMPTKYGRWVLRAASRDDPVET